MRNRKDRALAREPAQCPADFRFGRGIERRCRLIQHQQVGRMHKRARNRETLALSAGQGRAAFADRRIQSLRHRLDEIERLGGLEGTPHVVFSEIVAAENDIRAHGVVEQHQFLRHVTDMLAPCEKIGFGKVDAVDQHTARGRRHKPEHRIDQRGLAAAGCTDEGAERARRDRQIDILQPPPRPS